MNDRKKRRRRRSGNALIDILNGLLTLLVIALVVLAGGLLFVASQYYGEGPLTEERVFRVETGASLSSTATRLEEQGIIGNSMIFSQFGTRVEENNIIRAGDFRIPAGASMAEV